MYLAYRHYYFNLFRMQRNASSEVRSCLTLTLPDCTYSSIFRSHNDSRFVRVVASMYTLKHTSKNVSTTKLDAIHVRYMYRVVVYD
jgi:hypothetical protein